MFSGISLLILALITYITVVGLLLTYGYLKNKNRYPDATYQYFCTACERHFDVVYHNASDTKPLDRVECPFCKNDVPALIVGSNNGDNYDEFLSEIVSRRLKKDAEDADTKR